MELPERLEGLPQRELEGGLVVVEAATFRSRLRGLARLDELPAHAALHIPKCKSVHTFTMRFDLDLVWLDKHGDLVRLDRAVPPRRHRSVRKARSVVEIAAGNADAFLAAGLAG